MDSRLAKRRGARSVDATRPGREPPAVPRSALHPERSAHRPYPNFSLKYTHYMSGLVSTTLSLSGALPATLFWSTSYWLAR